jgi:hypothetical protein
MQKNLEIPLELSNPMALWKVGSYPHRTSLVDMYVSNSEW